MIKVSKLKENLERPLKKEKRRLHLIAVGAVHTIERISFRLSKTSGFGVRYTGYFSR